MMTIVLINLDGDQYWREEGKYKTRTAKTKPADFDILVMLIMIMVMIKIYSSWNLINSQS